MIQARPKFEMTGLTARSPAKLIISGEHAVVYGQPALAVALDLYTTTTTSWSEGSRIHFYLNEFAHASSYTLSTLKSLTERLRDDYQAFLRGKIGIREVLGKPIDLLQCAVHSLVEYFNVQLPRGLRIEVSSEIPIGCGMGSSAAVLISTLYALSNFFEYDWQLVDLLRFGRELENLQHGNSSGLDLHLVAHGGCVRFEQGKVESIKMQSLMQQAPIYVINTGKPQSTTGECVQQVRGVLAHDLGLQHEFACVTEHMYRALQQDDLPKFKAAIQANQVLLQRIGVVPQQVAEFIKDLGEHGAAAKVCGAGSVHGSQAGVVMMVLGQQDLLAGVDQELAALVKHYGYEMQQLNVDNYGTRIV